MKKIQSFENFDSNKLSFDKIGDVTNDMVDIAKEHFSEYLNKSELKNLVICDIPTLEKGKSMEKRQVLTIKGSEKIRQILDVHKRSPSGKDRFDNSSLYGDLKNPGVMEEGVDKDYFMTNDIIQNGKFLGVSWNDVLLIEGKKYTMISWLGEFAILTTIM